MLHLIGPLQSNKAKEAVALFDATHSVDRPSICEALATQIKSRQRTPELFSPAQHRRGAAEGGIAPGEADAFILSCREKYGLPISGLMCIPPVNDAPAPHFALTAKIAARNRLTKLSMGMSADFAIAIQMGATHVRVGSAIFGAPVTPLDFYAEDPLSSAALYHRHCEERSDEAIPFFPGPVRWIACAPGKLACSCR